MDPATQAVLVKMFLLQMKSYEMFAEGLITETECMNRMIDSIYRNHVQFAIVNEQLKSERTA